MKIIDAFVELLKEICCEVKYVLQYNLYLLGFVLELANPYIMYFVCSYLYFKRGQVFKIGLELLIPIFLIFISAYFKKISDKCGKGLSAPIPESRFTEVNYESGEVTIDTERLQEMMLYVADVEDWLEKTGRL